MRRVLTLRWIWPLASNCARGDLVTTTAQWANHAIENSRTCFKAPGFPPGGGVSGRFLRVTARFCGPESSERLRGQESGFPRFPDEGKAFMRYVVGMRIAVGRCQ